MLLESRATTSGPARQLVAAIYHADDAAPELASDPADSGELSASLGCTIASTRRPSGSTELSHRTDVASFVSSTSLPPPTGRTSQHRAGSSNAPPRSPATPRPASLQTTGARSSGSPVSTPPPKGLVTSVPHPPDPGAGGFTRGSVLSSLFRLAGSRGSAAGRPPRPGAGRRSDPVRNHRLWQWLVVAADQGRRLQPPATTHPCGRRQTPGHPVQVVDVTTFGRWQP